MNSSHLYKARKKGPTPHPRMTPHANSSLRELKVFISMYFIPSLRFLSGSHTSTPWSCTKPVFSREPNQCFRSIMQAFLYFLASKGCLMKSLSAIKACNLTWWGFRLFGLSLNKTIFAHALVFVFRFNKIDWFSSWNSLKLLKLLKLVCLGHSLKLPCHFEVQNKVMQ